LCVREWHGGRIARDYLDIAATETRSQCARRFGVEFDRCESLERQAQPIRGEAGSWTKLQYMWSKVSIGENPGYSLPNGFSPSIGAAEPLMQAVHITPSLQPESMLPVAKGCVLSILCQWMSQKRQTAIFDRSGDRKSPITTLTHDYPAGHMIPLHFHDRDQLIYASRGVMTVGTGEGTWVVPTHRAVWIPAAVPHAITISGLVAMRTLYFRPKLARALPRDCCVVNVSPLLKELILHACRFHALRKTIPWQRHVIEMVIDQLETVQMLPLQLPHLSDPRAVRVADIVAANPGDHRTLIQICKAGGASKRTVERLFQEEAGMTFGKWRQQLRLMQAMRLLAEGAKVTHAALEAGYSTPSAFSCMFRKTLGTTPSWYFRMDNQCRRLSDD
jgi:AraC-like DNA-binding protein